MIQSSCVALQFCGILTQMDGYPPTVLGSHVVKPRLSYFVPWDFIIQL